MSTSKSGFAILRRQVNGDYSDDDNDGDGDYWGYSPTAMAVKWSFIGAILLLFVIWFVGGYYHAQRRIKRGLPPMAYHRFLLPRHQRMRYMPRPQYGYHPEQHGHGEGYPMQTYPAPPPAYNAEHGPPPVYQPPEGGSKINPSQDYARPPPGPPPRQIPEEASSSAMHNVPLHQASAGQETFSGDLPARTKRPGLMSRLNPFK